MSQGANTSGWIACAKIVEQADPERFAAAMAAPIPARTILFPLYAFNTEIARAPWVTKEAMIAEMRLQWWWDALEEIAETGTVRRHDVTTPLADCISRDIAVMLQQSVEARRWDIYTEAFDDADHFERYIDHTAGHLMWAGARCLGAPPTSEATIRDLAFAAGLSAFLRAIPELEARGRCPLVDGRPEAVAALAQEALTRLNRFTRRSVPQSAWPALISAFAARTRLTRALSQPGAVAQGRLQLSPLGKSWALMKAGRAWF